MRIIACMRNMGNPGSLGERQRNRTVACRPSATKIAWGLKIKMGGVSMFHVPKNAIAASLLLLFTAACSSGVTRDTNLNLTHAQFTTPGREAGDVSISLSPQAQKELVDNLKFDQDKLLYTIRRALEAKGILGKEK